MRIPFQPKSIPNRVLSFDNPHWQRTPNAREHERCPLPPERVDDNAKDEPIHQFRVSEEIEGSSWGTTFDELGHVDPSFHPLFLWPRERVDEEHEKQARIDSNVVLCNFEVSLPSSALELRFQQRSGVERIPLQCLGFNQRKRFGPLNLHCPPFLLH